MKILQTIVKEKQRELEVFKSRTDKQDLLREISKQINHVSISAHISNKETAIIAEHKIKSPSKSRIASDKIRVTEIARQYEDSGAAAMSVLTDQTFFGGSKEDLIQARSEINIPILRKEFIIDPIQIYETKALRADAILLIAKILDKKFIEDAVALSHELGLEVLLEIHDEDDLSKLPKDVDLIGVNNRDLRSFTVDFNHSIRLFPKLPDSTIKISESGISDPATIKVLKECGFDGFLIGEHLMKSDNPGGQLSKLIKESN